jgi:hypothetical protein
LSTQELPELAGRAGLRKAQVRPRLPRPPAASGFEETEDGGFIVYVQSRLPVDSTAMSANLPQFTAALRRERSSAAFNNGFKHAAVRDQLRITPVRATSNAAAAIIPGQPAAGTPVAFARINAM